MELRIETCTRGVAVVVAVIGEVDIHTAPQVSERLATLQAEGHLSLVVDLAGVTFLDSSALGALIAAQRDLAAAGGELRLAGARPHIRKILGITRLTDVISLYDDVDAACG